MNDMKSVLESRAARYRQLLQDEGYAVMAPDWKEDVLTWMVRLRYEQATMYFLFDIEDPSFVRLVLPNFFEIENGPTEQVLSALDRTNISCNVAKVYLTPDAGDVVSSVAFLDDGDSASAVMLVRYLTLALFAAKYFAKEMHAARDA
jgi:hypothetical protein